MAGWPPPTCIPGSVYKSPSAGRETYPDGTVRVTAGLKTALKSCRDISRTSFTSDANLESIDFSEEHRLTLSGAGENWTVAWDAFSSDFGRMESGYATNHRTTPFAPSLSAATFPCGPMPWMEAMWPESRVLHRRSAVGCL